MTEPAHSSRQTPKRPSAFVRDLTMLVTVVGSPEATRAFTDAEHADAATYAAEVGGVVVPLLS